MPHTRRSCSSHQHGRTISGRGSRYGCTLGGGGRTPAAEGRRKGGPVAEITSRDRDLDVVVMDANACHSCWHQPRGPTTDDAGKTRHSGQRRRLHACNSAVARSPWAKGGCVRRELVEQLPGARWLWQMALDYHPSQYVFIDAHLRLKLSEGLGCHRKVQLPDVRLRGAAAAAVTAPNCWSTGHSALHSSQEMTH